MKYISTNPRSEIKALYRYENMLFDEALFLHRSPRIVRPLASLSDLDARNLQDKMFAM